MRIAEVQKALDAELLCGESILEDEVKVACGSDLMSDVLAFVEGKTMLLTGMTNPHVVRTCEMVDIHCIVFVRGKKPTDDIVEMARESGMAILCCPYTLYTACGLLYEKGMRGHETAKRDQP